MKDVIVFKHIGKPGGIMAGHDYSRAGVEVAVRKIFNSSEFETQGNVWIVHKENVNRDLL